MNPSTLVSIFLLVGGATATTFSVRNNCPFPVWAAGIPYGGGTRLDSGSQPWTFDVPAGASGARIWGRTQCNNDASSCQTGTCAGGVQCQGSGQTPATLAEYTLNGGTNGNQDFYDISLVDGFNLPMEFSPDSGSCRGIRCTADIKGQCPAELKVDGGCNNRDGYASFFKGQCPDAYSFPGDDQSSTFTCSSGTNYRVVFCP